MGKLPDLKSRFGKNSVLAFSANYLAGATFVVSKDLVRGGEAIRTQADAESVFPEVGEVRKMTDDQIRQAWDAVPAQAPFEKTGWVFHAGDKSAWLYALDAEMVVDVQHFRFLDAELVDSLGRARMFGRLDDPTAPLVDSPAPDNVTLAIVPEQFQDEVLRFVKPFLPQRTPSGPGQILLDHLTRDAALDATAKLDAVLDRVVDQVNSGALDQPGLKMTAAKHRSAAPKRGV